MKRAVQDIRENLEWVGCDNETVLELCAEVERLREYRDHHEFVLSQIEAATRVKISTVGDVLAEINRLQAIIDRQHAALIVAGTECDGLGESDLHALACIAGTEDGRCEPSDDDYAEAYIRAVEAL